MYLQCLQEENMFMRVQFIKESTGIIILSNMFRLKLGAYYLLVDLNTTHSFADHINDTLNESVIEFQDFKYSRIQLIKTIFPSFLVFTHWVFLINHVCFLNLSKLTDNQGIFL